LIAVTFIELLLILVEIQNLIGLADAPSHDSQALASGAADKHYAGLERKSNVEEAELAYIKQHKKLCRSSKA
jgi:hypothetical protein